MQNSISVFLYIKIYLQNERGAFNIFAEIIFIIMQDVFAFLFIYYFIA